MAVYQKDYLIDCYLYRLRVLGTNKEMILRDIANKQYDREGKTLWRKHATVDAQAIREFDKFLQL